MVEARTAASAFSSYGSQIEEAAAGDDEEPRPAELDLARAEALREDDSLEVGKKKPRENCMSCFYEFATYPCIVHTGDA